jgi:zinc protease
VLILSGIADAAEGRRLAEEAFGSWTATSANVPAAPAEPPPPAPRRIVLVDQPGAIQSQIRIGHGGFRRDAPDYPTSRVVSDYFGESFSSRLNEVIRVQKGLTYGARGGFKSDKWAGQFEISTFSKTETTAAAVQAALDEVARLRTDPPTDAELRDTKSAFLGRLALQRETPQQIAEELWRAVLYGLPDDHVERTLAAAERVTPDECLRFARQRLDPERLVIVVVGDASRLQADLEKIAPVTVITRSE